MLFHGMHLCERHSMHNDRAHLYALEGAAQLSGQQWLSQQAFPAKLSACLPTHSQGLPCADRQLGDHQAHLPVLLEGPPAPAMPVHLGTRNCPLLVSGIPVDTQQLALLDGLQGIYCSVKSLTPIQGVAEEEVLAGEAGNLPDPARQLPSPATIESLSLQHFCNKAAKHPNMMTPYRHVVDHAAVWHLAGRGMAHSLSRSCNVFCVHHTYVTCYTYIFHFT